MRLSALALASILTAVLASQAEPNATHQLEARDPTFGLVHGILGGLLGGGHSSVHLPSRNWQCSGRGNDGYQVDCYGNRRPSHIPQGWAWFGLSIGWAPTSSWSCSSNFKFSAEFLSKAHLVTWWAPSTSWKKHNAGIDLGVSIGHWGLLPSRGWKCSGSGKDGWSVDWQGNSRPSWVPVGWLWFGEEISWGPPAGFDIGINVNLPSFWLPKAHLCSWWKPSTKWLTHHSGGLDISIVPGFWNLTPSRGWKCSGSGRDGWTVDWQGNSRPSWVPVGWLWFGEEISWGPPAGFDLSIDVNLPSIWLPKAHLCSWWKPSATWLSHHSGSLDISIVPGFWNLKPSSSWKCNGSGKDGWSVDHHGNGPPSWVPSGGGWFWFGIEIGWAPSSSWSCGSSWTIPAQWQSSCGKATWWTPPSSWVSKHHGHKWQWSFTPPKHWGCEVPSTTSLPPVKVTTTPVRATTTSRVVVTTSSKPKTTTTSKPKTTTSSKPKTTSSAAHHTTTSKPKPTSTAGSGSGGGGGGSHTTLTVTKTVTKIVSVPTSSTGGSCVCEEEQHRLARRTKSRLD